MEVICLHEDALLALFDKVIEHVNHKFGIKEDKWISGPEAMQKLRIRSKTTLQRLRDEGKIKFSQPDKKTILYDVTSIYEYLETYAQNPF